MRNLPRRAPARGRRKRRTATEPCAPPCAARPPATRCVRPVLARLQPYNQDLGRSSTGVVSRELAAAWRRRHGIASGTCGVSIRHHDLRVYWENRGPAFRLKLRIRPTGPFHRPLRHDRLREINQRSTGFTHKRRVPALPPRALPVRPPVWLSSTGPRASQNPGAVARLTWPDRLTGYHGGVHRRDPRACGHTDHRYGPGPRLPSRATLRRSSSRPSWRARIRPTTVARTG